MEEAKNNKSKQNIPRILLVGAGKMGSNHLRVLSADKSIQVVGVVEPFLKPELPEGLKLYTSLIQVDPYSFDAALIATPTETHFEVAKQLIELKKFLLLE